VNDIYDRRSGCATDGVAIHIYQHIICRSCVGPDQNSIGKTSNIEILDKVVGRVQKDSSRCNRNLIVIDAAEVANSASPVDTVNFRANRRGNRGASRKVYV